MKNKKNNIVLYLVLIYVVTLFIPIILFITKPTFTICSFIDYIKDFSFTVWALLFSCSWLHYKKIIKDNEHLRIVINQRIEQNAEKVLVEALAKRNKELETRIAKLNNAEMSIKSLEIALAVVGILVGAFGLVSFFINLFTTCK